VIYGRLYGEDGRPRIARVARTAHFYDRMRGLLGTSGLPQAEALLIDPCSSIHTWGMRYTIDAAFLDRNWTIIRIVRGLKPWRMAACAAAVMVLETCEGGLETMQLYRGIKLEWRTDE